MLSFSYIHPLVPLGLPVSWHLVQWYRSVSDNKEQGSQAVISEPRVFSLLLLENLYVVAKKIMVIIIMMCPRAECHTVFLFGPASECFFKQTSIFQIIQNLSLHAFTLSLCIWSSHRRQIYIMGYVFLTIGDCVPCGAPLFGVCLCTMTNLLSCWRNYTGALENNHTGWPHLCIHVVFIYKSHTTSCSTDMSLWFNSSEKCWILNQLVMVYYSLSWLALLHKIRFPKLYVWIELCTWNLTVIRSMFPCLPFTSTISLGCTYLYIYRPFIKTGGQWSVTHGWHERLKNRPTV